MRVGKNCIRTKSIDGLDHLAEHIGEGTFVLICKSLEHLHCFALGHVFHNLRSVQKFVKVVTNPNCTDAEPLDEAEVVLVRPKLDDKAGTLQRPAQSNTWLNITA